MSIVVGIVLSLYTHTYLESSEENNDSSDVVVLRSSAIMLSTLKWYIFIFGELLLIGASVGQSARSYKGYSGFRVSDSSKLLIFHHEQTIAVVELLHKKMFVGCELIEVL